MLIYASHIAERGADSWALDWDTTTTVGLRADNPHPDRNYLMPLDRWTAMGELFLQSARTGDLSVENFSIDPEANYTISFDATGSGGMNYHNNRPLSTVDQDNDNWGASCAGRARSFGWYGSCCNLCMTTRDDGAWGSGAAYAPSDWSYRATDWMRWWAKP